MSDDQAPCPGHRIKAEMEARGWTQAVLAQVMGRTQPIVNDLISGRRSITADTAVQLERALGVSARVWMDLDAAFQLSRIHQVDAGIEHRAKLLSFAPLKEMQKRGWIQDFDEPHLVERELCRFFAIETIDSTPVIDALTRRSDGIIPLNIAQRAWCFRAKHLARGVMAEKYEDANLANALRELKKLAAYQEECRKVPRVLAAAGIRFVVVEPLPKTRIDGVAFWLDPQSPVVALSMRFDRIDNFWHVLGHELSHIRHRDSAVVDSDIGDADRQLSEAITPIESRAEQEAAAMWIDPPELDGFIQRVGPMYSKARINQFANRIRIHPGIITGQLQHRRQISFSANREMLVKVRDTVLAESAADGWGRLNPPV